MRDGFRSVVTALAVMFCLATSAFVQHTTGSIEGTVTNAIGTSDIDPTYNAAKQTLTNVMNRTLNGQIGPQIERLANGSLRSLTGRPNPVSSLHRQPSGYQGTRAVRFGFRFTF